MFGLACITLILASISATLFITNLALYAQPRDVETSAPACAISVLIPARNEAQNIASAIESVLANKNAKYEVIVGDDHSEDETAAIVRSLAARDGRVRLLSIPPLPVGWNGKQHACYWLARAAENPLLCYIDADVRLSHDALSKLTAVMGESESALISGIPLQRTETWFEKLEIPLIHFVLLGYLPIHRMRSSTNPAYAAGCGQLLVVRKDAYDRCGGHAAIRYTMHDGIKLPAAFRKAGLKTDLFDATPIAGVRMYSGAREVWDGLSKNATEGMATPGLLPIFTVLLFGGHVLPLIVFALAVARHDVAAAMIACAAVVLSHLPRSLGVARFQQPIISAVLHSVGVTVLLAIQWVALGKKLLGKSPAWRGRSYSQSISSVQLSEPAFISGEKSEITDFNGRRDLACEVAVAFPPEERTHSLVHEGINDR